MFKVTPLYELYVLSMQRTDRAPKDRNIAETDPPKFAEMLMKKLEKVLEDQQRTQKLQELVGVSKIDISTDIYLIRNKQVYFRYPFQV